MYSNLSVKRNEIAIIHSYYDSSGVSQYQQVTIDNRTT